MEIISRATLAEDLNVTMGRADNNIWFKPAKKANGPCYYIYVLVYTDDILCVAENPKVILDKFDKHFLLKPESRGKPKIYLGAEIGTSFLRRSPENLIGACVHRLTPKSQ